jgi:hypothetical protein
MGQYGGVALAAWCPGQFRLPRSSVPLPRTTDALRTLGRRSTIHE